MSHVQTVQEIYGAFGSGDIPTLLGHLADDVAWEQWENNTLQNSGAPWFKEHGSRDGAAEFFGVIGQWDVNHFAVLSLMDGGDRVAAEIEIDMGLPGGVTLRDEEMHVWYFDDDGKVSKFRHYVDTAKHEAAGREAGLIG
jgi:ketosteroid isomerase-like protein